MAIAAIGFAAGGLIGTYSYIENYALHRGFPTPARLANAIPGRLETVHFYSPALHRRDSYVVYLPGGYTPSKRYPVVYLLHGSPGRPANFTSIAHIEVRMDNLISRHRIGPMILVFPDGRVHGDQFSDSEWANTPTGSFETSVLEVVRNVDQRFATVADRRHRVIAGLSAGGYGALNIALHHLRVFGAVQVWSGYFTQTRTGVFSRATSAQLAYNSPLDYVTRLGRLLRRNPLRVFLFVGRSDFSSGIRTMARALEAAGASAHRAIYPGGHDWQLWNQHFDQMLTLAWRDMTGAPRR